MPWVVEGLSQWYEERLLTNPHLQDLGKAVIEDRGKGEERGGGGGPVKVWRAPVGALRAQEADAVHQAQLEINGGDALKVLCRQVPAQCALQILLQHMVSMNSQQSNNSRQLPHAHEDLLGCLSLTRRRKKQTSWHGQNRSSFDASRQLLAHCVRGLANQINSLCLLIGH